jgi:beta-glucanase (GH16 family)
MRLRLFVLLSILYSLSCSSSEEPAPDTPQVEVGDISKTEGDDGITVVDFNIGLAKAVAEDVILKYATDDASAFQGLDYKKASGQITIPAGSAEASISLEIVADLIKEGNEQFKLLLSSDMDVEFNKGTVLVTIGNDDTQLPYDTEDYETPASYAGWSLAWADEFDGTEINTEWWTHEIGNGDNGWGNNELEYYTDATENSRIEDGKLVIEARDDSWNGQKYTSARMITRDKKSFASSRTDIRARLPFGQGIWPTLWMLGNNLGDKGWPACGEIDIMELVGHQPATSHATVHWGSSFDNHKYTGKGYNLSGEIFNDRFHVFTVVREFNRMWFYIDDVLFYEFSSKDLQGQPNPFNESFFFIFNVAIGGNWPGSPDETTVFPQFMKVDYIRVFEKES